MFLVDFFRSIGILVILEIYEFLLGTPSPLGNPPGFRGVSEKLE